MSYNGWKNKETWLVNLWFGDYLQDLADEGERMDADRIEQVVLDYVDDMHTPDAGLIADFINMCLAEIDFHELARHYEVEEAVEEDA